MAVRLRRPRFRRLWTAGLWGLAAVHVAEALVLRQRRRQLRSLGTEAVGATPPVDADEAAPDAPTLTTLPGVEVDQRTIAAVAQEMASGKVEVVDLVPGDLPVERALRLLRRVDPDQLGDDPVYAPGGAHEAVALHGALVDRMASRPPAETSDRGELHRWTVNAQRYAPTGAVVRIAPALRATDQDPEDRWRELDESLAGARNIMSLPLGFLGMETAHLLALTGGLLVVPLPAVVALVTWSAQPVAVFATGGRAASNDLRPRDLVAATLLRLGRRWSGNIDAWKAYRHSRRRAAVSAAPAPDPAELFEARRSTCPWCGSEALAGVLDTPDLLQGKPGHFHLDECADCGHIFQNPALSLAGLDYYYENFYDGVSEEQWEASFAGTARGGLPRIEAVARVATPKTWLDVGTGHGHFCLVARHELPGTVIDGLDMGESVEEAARRGWIDTAYRGQFPDLADRLAGAYDVVSMHHYLEHTRDPRLELEAAAKVVRPDGHLEVEMPDPAHAWSRRLGRYWLCWLQPQHQHIPPCENLVAALDEVGFDVVSVERGTATMGNDLLFAVCLAVQHVARSPHAPWLPPASWSLRAKRLAAIWAAVPVGIVAIALDRVKDAQLRPDEPGNAYRIVARRRRSDESRRV